MTAAPLNDRPDHAVTESPAASPVAPDVQSSDPAINRDVVLARAGDLSRRDGLYAIFHPTMAKFVGRFTQRSKATGVWDLDDVWQETFVVFAEVVNSWPGAGEFIAYFYAVFPKRLAANVRLLDGRQPYVVQGLADESDEPTHDPGPTVDARVVLTGYIATLPPIERQILALHVWEELPLLDVAEHMGISVTATLQRWRTMRRSALRHRSTPG